MHTTLLEEVHTVQSIVQRVVPTRKSIVNRAINYAIRWTILLRCTTDWGTVAVLISEFLTTALLVICSCLASSSQDKTAVSLGSIALSAGLIQLVLMNCFGQISGAHGNPAVSLALWYHGSMNLRRLIVYVSGQTAGAAVGHSVVRNLLDKPINDPMCTFQPKPGLTDLNIMGYEFLMTFLIVMAWCAIWDYETPLELYLAIVNALIALMGGVFSGTSTNPAITLAPIFFTGKSPKIHLYLASELAAAIAAPFLVKKLRRWMNENGFVVIEDFLTPDETAELFEAGKALCMEAPEANRKIFSTIKCADTHSKETYFLESGDKVRYFFEEGALDDNGELVVDPMCALNKVGHALHVENPIFKKYTFSNKIREICWQLNFNRPAVCQSMYIYKNPGIGGEVISHQDSWFLYTEPNTVIGFWIALEDCTEQNGCLQFIKGSHKSGTHRRYVRNPDKSAKELMIYNSPTTIYPRSSFTNVTVKKGTMIIIHGNVVHKSETNFSKKSRHAYTFHVVETENNVKYAEDNWLQPPKDKPFPILFERKN